MTSTVFAATVNRTEEVRGKSYTSSYSGSVGHYTAAGDSSSARTTVVNTSTSQRWFQCYIYRYNFSSKSYDSQDVYSGLISNGATKSVEIVRDKDSMIYDYEHIAMGYHTSVYINGAVADEFTYDALQYYRD